MTEMEQALSVMAERYRSGLVHAQAMVERLHHSHGGQYQEAKRHLAMYCQEKALIDDTNRLLAFGLQTAIENIKRVLTNRANQAHTRWLAVVLLASIDSTATIDILYGRVVDKTEAKALRFGCAIYLGLSKQATAPSRLLWAVNSKTTDDDIDDKLMRASLVGAGLPVNLRLLLISALQNLPGGAVWIDSMLSEPVKYQIGWLYALLFTWTSNNDDERYILMAARVVANRAYPESLRVKAANSLFVMRQKTRGNSRFPKTAWDILHQLWGETDSGELHHAVGLVLKLQGASG